MPQPFPQPRHRDDTPDTTPLIDPDAPRAVIVGLEPNLDRTSSPLRRALRAAGIRAAGLLAPLGIRRRTHVAPDSDQETQTK